VGNRCSYTVRGNKSRWAINAHKVTLACFHCPGTVLVMKSRDGSVGQPRAPILRCRDAVHSRASCPHAGIYVPQVFTRKLAKTGNLERRDNGIASSSSRSRLYGSIVRGSPKMTSYIVKDVWLRCEGRVQSKQNIESKSEYRARKYRKGLCVENCIYNSRVMLTMRLRIEAAMQVRIYSSETKSKKM
jgi:hypothetical protein